MKNAILLHGYGDTPDSYWFPWLKDNLAKRGYEVWAPQLPDTNNPKIAAQLPFVLQYGVFTPETIIIGHSAGCPLTLGILGNIELAIKQAILVSGFASPLPGDPESSMRVLDVFDWDRIKEHVKDITFINSDNDPWGCDDSKGREMFDKLGGTLIIPHGEGHMGSDRFNQPYKEFPLLLKLID